MVAGPQQTAAEANVFKANSSVGNRDNGFNEDAGGPGNHTYRKNIAIKNTNYGILAPNGVTASFGNFVLGNGMGCSPGLGCFPQS